MTALTLKSGDVKPEEIPLLHVIERIREIQGTAVTLDRLDTGYDVEVSDAGFAEFVRAALRDLEGENQLPPLSEEHNIVIFEDDDTTKISSRDCLLLEIVLRLGFKLMRKSQSA